MVATALLIDESYRLGSEIRHPHQTALLDLGREITKHAALLPEPGSEALALAAMIRAGALALHMLTHLKPPGLTEEHAAEFRQQPSEFILQQTRGNYRNDQRPGMPVLAHRARAAIDELPSDGKFPQRDTLMRLVQTVYTAVKEYEKTQVLAAVVERTSRAGSDMPFSGRRDVYWIRDTSEILRKTAARPALPGTGLQNLHRPDYPVAAARPH